MRIVFGFILLFLGSLSTAAQELVTNGDAEQPLWVGWHQVNPLDTWKESNTTTDAVRAPHGGSFLFYPYKGQAATSELYQDISVASNASAIDAGTASYTFSGWRRGYKNISPFSADMDRSQIIVEYQNASGTVLGSFDTGSAVFTSWTQSTDTRFAPVGTRTIRIRLISVQVSGAENDGYYDDISLIYNPPPVTCTPPTSILLIPNTTTTDCVGNSLVVAGVASPANSNYYYTWYHNGTPITTASQTYTSISKPTTVAGDAGVYTLRVEDGNAGSASCYKESSVTIILDAPPVAGTISSSAETCGNTIPAPFTGTPSTGGTGAKYYKWQISTGTVAGPWVDLQTFSTTATGYTSTTAVTLINYYRRIDSSGTCANVTTNVLTIKAKNPPALDPITSLVRDTLCVGESFQLTPHLTGFPVSLNGGFYYSWRKIQGATSTVVVPNSLTMSSYPASPVPAAVADSGTYYFIAQDGPGVTQCKDSVKIVIRINQAPTTKALIQSHQEICKGDPANQLTQLSAGTGTVGSPLYYQWYTTTDTTGTPVLTKIPASTGTNYNPGTPLSTLYYVRSDSVKYCAATKTNFLKIRVNNKPNLDSIRATVNDTLCVNNGDQFQLKGYIDSLTSGKQSLNGGFYFTWKKVQQPATIASVVSPAAPYTDYPAVSRPVIEADSGTYYLIVQDGANTTKCLDSISFKLTVYQTCIAITCAAPDFVSIKVSSSSSTTLCSGNTLSLEKDVIQLPSTPPTFGYMYSWVRTNTLGTVVVQGPSATYQDLIVNSVSAIDSGRYELIVQDGTTTPAACAEKSASISITVYDPITPAQIGNDTTICAGNTLSPFVELTANTGGTGSYTHQWQSSPDNITFTDISGATNTSYQSPPVSSITYFRRIDKSGICAIATSDTITVTTSIGAVAGTIASANPTLCYNTIPPQTISNVSPASGGTGGSTATYQWQQSADNVLWTDIPGATSSSYTESNPLTDTTYYRRKTGTGPGSCDTAYTTAVVINVFAPPTTGSIGRDTSVCSGSTVHIKELTPAIGSSITYKWVQSVDKGVTWTPAPGNITAKDYTTPGLTDTTWYKRVAYSSCGHDSSNIVRVSVIFRPIVSAGPDSTVQKNSSIVLQGSVIGSTHYIWIPSTGLNNASILNPTATIRGTITYILRAHDATGTCYAESSVTIYVKPPLVIPNVITPNGDGTNDTWKIKDIEEYPDATFVIYNRWGNIVWKSSNGSLEWNGTNYRNGEVLPDGTYFYIIDLKSISYEEPLTGYVQIIK